VSKSRFCGVALLVWKTMFVDPGPRILRLREPSSTNIPGDLVPIRGAVPQKRKLPTFGCWAARTACAGADSVTTCVLLFFVLVPGSTITSLNSAEEFEGRC
jgi:hypothetical protein